MTRLITIRAIAVLFAALAAQTFLWPSAIALAAEGSRCLAMAQAPGLNTAPRVSFVSDNEPTLWRAALGSDDVRIAYVTHATFRIETATGTIIATDYAGFAGRGPLPTVVTMNHAHETHYTDFPDPAIAHVLRGWNPAGGPAHHHLRVGDVLIRNVPTDIRTWGGGREADGNSVFIFEAAGLCIGHLGHLHHELTPDDLASIGQLDIVMAPVDGSFTLDQPTLVKTLKVLKARIVIPMHAFGPISLAAFIDRMREDFAITYVQNSEFIASTATLPDKPTVLVLPESVRLTWD